MKTTPLGYSLASPSTDSPALPGVAAGGWRRFSAATPGRSGGVGVEGRRE